MPYPKVSIPIVGWVGWLKNREKGIINCDSDE